MIGFVVIDSRGVVFGLIAIHWLMVLNIRHVSLLEFLYVHNNGLTHRPIANFAAGNLEVQQQMYIILAFQFAIFLITVNLVMTLITLREQTGCLTSIL